MAASNADVIESLKLEIDIGIKGKDALDGFISKLNTLAESLERVNERLSEYASRTSKSLGAVATPQTTTTPTSEIPMNTSGMETIAASAEQATQSAEQLVTVQGEVSEALNNTAKSAQKASAAVKKTADDTEKASKSAKKASGHFGGLLKSFIRIAKYRMMRAILRGIIEGFREGIQNLAQYDSAFNETMSSFVSSTAYLKNALGTLAQPILELVVPAIVQVIDYIVEAINKLNALIAALKGEETYTAAVKYSKNYADNLSSASNSAKELKNTLMGFDEINKLNDNSSASAGSSGGISAADMFEERAVNSTLSDETIERMVNFKMTVEDVLFDWSDLNSEQIAEKVTAAVPTLLGAIIGGALGGPAGAVVGAAIGLAFGLILDSIIFNHNGKLEPSELLKSVVGLSGTLLGAIVGAGLGGPVGAVIGATIGAVLAIAFSLDVDGSLEEKATAFAETLRSMWSSIKSWGELMSDALKDTGERIQHWANAMVAFAHGDWKTGFKEMGEAIGGGLSEGTESKWRDFADKMRNLCQNLINTVLSIFGIHSPSTVFKEIGENVVAGFFNGFKEKWDASWASAKEKLANFKTSFVNAATEIKNKVTTAFNNIQSNITSTMDKVSNKVSNTWNGIKSGARNFVNNVIGAIEHFVNQIIYGLNVIVAKARNIINNLPESVRNALHLDKIFADQLSYISIPRYATGGFPEDGIFMANQSELVGQFSNGKTAVANNAQIQEGIEEAAYRGFMRAMSSTSNNNNGTYTFVAQLNGKTLFEEVVKQNNSATKVYGGSPLTSY